MKKQGIQDEMEYSYIQFTAGTQLLNAVDSRWNCVFERRSTDDELDSIVQHGQVKRRRKNLQALYWSLVELSSTINDSGALVDQYLQSTAVYVWPLLP